jgi:hypothetical protein
LYVLFKGVWAKWFTIVFMEFQELRWNVTQNRIRV